MPADLAGMALIASVWIIPVLLAVTLHEAAHGWAAWKLGDDTAKVLGRVSFNPLRHIDPFGTVLLPAFLLAMSAPFLFGWAKPVPVNFMRLREPRRSMVLVAAAGPMMNFTLAYIAALAVHLLPLLPNTIAPWVGQNLLNFITLNVILAVFNMLPIPPLDGGRVAVGLLPPALAHPLARLERYGFMIIIGVMFLLPYVSRQLGQNIDPFQYIVLGPVNYLIRIIAIAAGIQ